MGQWPPGKEESLPTEKAEVTQELKPEELREISTIRDEGKTFPAEGALQSVSGARMD